MAQFHNSVNYKLVLGGGWEKKKIKGTFESGGNIVSNIMEEFPTTECSTSEPAVNAVTLGQEIGIQFCFIHVFPWPGRTTLMGNGLIGTIWVKSVVPLLAGEMGIEVP